MYKWKEDFVGNTQKKCVHVNHNGDFDHGKVLYMEPDWSYFDFLNAASHRLNMCPAAKRLFNADGVEIDDCMMIEDDDILFLSIVDDFIAPTSHFSEGSTAEHQKLNGTMEHEKIPHSIGGYKVGEVLGRGGFGVVCVGEHHLTGERVALKFLKKSEILSLGAAERTNTEIQCLTALKHMNIIRLQQHAESINHVVLVFELMDGGDLLKYLQKQRTGIHKKTCVPEDEARHIFYQVLSAVSYAHNQHICHRDLKLENILLKDHSTAIVKIADFGLSDFYRPGATMKTNCGTLSFLAPEVFKGTANAGPPLDVWSLGVILFAILCGRLPFEGPDLNGTKRPRDAVIKSRILKCQYKIDEQLGSEAKDLVRRILQVDPAERATLPEIFNHVWVRSTSTNHYSDSYHFNNMIKSLGNSELLEGSSPHIHGKHRRTALVANTKQVDERHYSIDETSEPPLPPSAGAFVAGMVERQPSKADLSSSSGSVGGTSRHTPPIESGGPGGENAKIKDIDRSPIRSNARLLVSVDIPRATSSETLGKLLSENDLLLETELDTFDSSGTSFRPTSSSGTSNARHHPGGNNGSSLGTFTTSKDEVDTNSTGGSSDSYLAGAGKGSPASFQSPIFKLVPLRRSNTTGKDNDDEDDVYPTINFRSSSLSGDSNFGNNRSSSSAVARPSTVNAMPSGSSKRNGSSVIGSQSKDKSSMDVVDIDDSLSCGSSPGGIERGHFSSTRFLPTSSSGSRKSYTLSNNGTAGGKLSLNTNIFQDSTSIRGESKDSSGGHSSYVGGSVKRQQSITDSMLSPAPTSSKRDPMFGEINNQTLPPSTASGRSRNPTVTSSSRFRLPT